MKIPAKAIGKGLVAVAALAAALLLYNVTRHIVFWSPAEELTFTSNGVVLSGTLVKPAATGVFPAIVMLHGSGPDTRTEFSYRVMATTLVRRGFAVLLYDKRGAGASGGEFASARYSDFIDDAVAAVRYLAGRDDIRAGQIGLFGNSESGWLTPEIASRAGGVAFVINKAGPPLPWVDTVLWENRNEYLDGGVAEADVQRLLDLTWRQWRYYQRAGVDPSLASGEERDAIDAEIAEVRATVPFADNVLARGLRPYAPEWYARFAANSTYDPGRFLRVIDVPLLYVFSGLDVNVPTEASVAYLEALAAGHGKDITIHVFPDVGHSMATWRGAFNAGFVPGFLELVASWAGEQLRRDGATAAPARLRLRSAIGQGRIAPSRWYVSGTRRPWPPAHRPGAAKERTMALQIARRDIGAVTVLDLKGKLAAEAGQTLSDTVETLVRDGRRQVLLNLADVSFVDSAALGSLLALRGAVEKNGGTLKLSNVTSRISDLLVTTRLAVIFDSYDSEPVALQSFQG